MIDKRDSRLDIAFILGDPSIPDDVSWPVAERDRSCVWLDYVDASFSKCQVQNATSLIPNTSVSTAITPTSSIARPHTEEPIHTGCSINTDRITPPGAVIMSATQTKDIVKTNLSSKRAIITTPKLSVTAAQTETAEFHSVPNQNVIESGNEDVTKKVFKKVLGAKRDI